ncbi:MAG: DUF2147 domain-containing protein [Hyphomicrobiaceae bacterium]
MTECISKLRLAFLSAGMLAITASYAAAAPREAGVWYDDSGKGAVKLSVCGDKLCGHIYWLKDAQYPDGRPLLDRHNPNSSQRNRLICGLQVIGDLAPMDNGEWDTGWIYDPKEGKSYSVALSLADPDTLKVTGYLVMRMMGRTLTWKRAPDDLPSCAKQAAATPTPEATAKAAAAAPSSTKQTAKTASKKTTAKAAQGEVLPWADK